MSPQAQYNIEAKSSVSSSNAMLVRATRMVPAPVSFRLWMEASPRPSKTFAETKNGGVQEIQEPEERCQGRHVHRVRCTLMPINDIMINVIFRSIETLKSGMALQMFRSNCCNSEKKGQIWVVPLAICA
jgi:hypothetical protein